MKIKPWMLDMSFDVDPAAGGGAGGQPPAGAGDPPAGAGQPDPGAAPAPTGSPTPSPSSGGQPGADLEQLVEIKVGGQVEKIPLREALSRAQMGTDYRSKTQALADERRRWEADRQTILQQERDKWLRELQEEEQRKAANPQDPASQALQSTKELHAKLEDDKLDSALQAVSQKHQGVDEHQLLMAFNRQGLKVEAMTRVQLTEQLSNIAADLAKSSNEAFDKRFEELLTKGEHPRLKKHEEAVIARYLKEKEAKPAPVTGGAGLPAGQPKAKPKTLDEASDMALEMMGAGQQG